MRRAQSLDQGPGNRSVQAAPARRHDDAGARQQLQAAVADDANAAKAPEVSGLHGGGREPVPPLAHLGPGQGEQFDGDPVLEGAQAVIGEGDDPR